MDHHHLFVTFLILALQERVVIPIPCLHHFTHEVHLGFKGFRLHAQLWGQDLEQLDELDKFPIEQSKQSIL